ncbi:MAG: hypothetical protein JXM79_11370 [Sedimentisphaerales bacterium]|nr:hypothetical protein [Sedimentisphaerales bacterium]
MEKHRSNLFLIGAGFTKAVFPHAPLNKNLLSVLCQGAWCNTLKKYYREYKTEDIEILLTHLDLDILHIKATKQNALQEVRKTIEKQLAEYFQKFRFKEELLKTNKWLETLAKQLFKSNDAIVTTNYECFLEGLLDYYKVWHPMKGYANIYHPGERANSPKVRENPKGIIFYKIHGSEHFRECTTFNERGPTEKTIIGIVINKSIYPISGENTNLGWVERHCKEYIIAPSFVKIPHFQIADTVNKAILAAQNTQNMIICGSSLRNEDGFIRLILTGFMSKRIQNDKRLMIVDPNADSISGKIEKFWIDGTQNITIHLIHKNIEDGLGDLIKLLEDFE